MLYKGLGPSKNPWKNLEQTLPRSIFYVLNKVFSISIVFLLHLPQKYIKNTSSERALPGGGSDGPPKIQKMQGFSQVFKDFHASVCTYMCVCICPYAGPPPPPLKPWKNLQEPHQKCRSGAFKKVFWIFSCSLITQISPPKPPLKEPYLLLYKAR